MKTYKRTSLLKVVNPNKRIVVNPFKENVKAKQTHYMLKQIDQENKPFVELGKRDRKKVELMNISS